MSALPDVTGPLTLMALVWLLLALSWPSVVVDGVSVMRPQVTCLLQQIHHTASSTPDDQSKSSFQAIQMRSRDLNLNELRDWWIVYR